MSKLEIKLKPVGEIYRIKEVTIVLDGKETIILYPQHLNIKTVTTGRVWNRKVTKESVWENHYEHKDGGWFLFMSEKEAERSGHNIPVYYEAKKDANNFIIAEYNKSREYLFKELVKKGGQYKGEDAKYYKAQKNSFGDFVTCEE